LAAKGQPDYDHVLENTLVEELPQGGERQPSTPLAMFPKWLG